MHGGTFQSSMSFLVSFLGGDLRIWGGGDPGPFGSLRCLWRGGIKGSICTLSIRATLYFWLSPVSPLAVNFTISLVVFPNFWIFVPKAASFFTPRIESIFSLVLFSEFSTSLYEGFASYFESMYRFWKLCATYAWLFLSFFTIIK